jgi:hypothetical protein
VQVEDALARARPDVHDDAVVLEPGVPRGVDDELEHPLHLVGRELADVPERLDVTLGQDEEVRLGLRVDVADRDEPLALEDVLAVPDELAEEARLKQRGSPPR